MIVLDTNILMELLEHRRFYDRIVKILSSPAFKNAELAISALTVSNVFYLAESHKLPMKRVEALIKPYVILDVQKSDIDWALTHYQNRDFEDAVQIAVAIRLQADSFLTIDTRLAPKYSGLIDVKLISGSS